MATRALTIDTHDETVGDGIVVLDFWASWCQPCLRFAPVFERASERHADITFAKVNTEEEQELAQRYDVSAIPTLVIYRDGIPVYSEAGALPEPMLESLISQVRDLDMDDVRARYAQQQAEAALSE
ncbi:MAG: thioredoxin domain-containing protein [Kineosporiaceae bacterium]